MYTVEVEEEVVVVAATMLSGKCAPHEVCGDEARVPGPVPGPGPVPVVQPPCRRVGAALGPFILALPSCQERALGQSDRTA